MTEVLTVFFRNHGKKVTEMSLSLSDSVTKIHAKGNNHLPRYLVILSACKRKGL